MEHTIQFRIRYGETDQMGTYYNARALEWFEQGRTELCRATGKPYSQWEADGVLLPVVEAHVEFQGRAKYDDLLAMTTRVQMVSKTRMRFDVGIVHADTGRPVCRGYTIQAVVDPRGKPIRPPQWVLDQIQPETTEVRED